VTNEGIAGIVTLVADRHLSARYLSDSKKKGQKDEWQKNG
jgi:hypothetical protein